MYGHLHNSAACTQSTPYMYLLYRVQTSCSECVQSMGCSPIGELPSMISSTNLSQPKSTTCRHATADHMIARQVINPRQAQTKSLDSLRAYVCTWTWAKGHSTTVWESCTNWRWSTCWDALVFLFFGLLQRYLGYTSSPPVVALSLWPKTLEGPGYA